jgi:hypothetical protein
MQVGPLETPFGLSVFDKAGPPKYSVDLKLRGYDNAAENPKAAAIYNALHALDEFMVDQGVKNSKQWFKGDKSRDVLSELYTPQIRFSKDQNGVVKPYPPTIKVQLRKKNDAFETEVYDDKKRLIKDVPLEDIIVKGATLTTLMQCTGVWFAGGKYGLSWKAIQIRADKIPERIRGFAFLEDGEAGEQAPASSVKAKSQNQFQDLDDDEDGVDDEAALAPPSKPEEVHEEEEEEDVEEVAPAPVPAKAAPKKLVKTAPKVVAKK